MTVRNFLILLVIGGTVLTGCAQLAPAQLAPAVSEPAGSAAPTMAADNGEAEDALDAASDIQVNKLAFAGEGDTFLDGIASAIRQLGEPEHHRYVEIESGAGQVWQGETLAYSDRHVAFLQAVQAGSETGLRVESPPHSSLQQLAQHLPDAQAPSALFDVDIQFVRARHNGDNGWTFDVTVAHPDTGWEDYVDGWHVETAEGEILGTRILLHPHVGEQPFTRSISNVVLPESINEVVIRSHDLISGYGPNDFVVNLSEAVRTDRYEVVR